ncbi:hypothetical protein SLA2020_196080 [Shorea laevis]
MISSPYLPCFFTCKQKGGRLCQVGSHTEHTSYLRLPFSDLFLPYYPQWEVSLGSASRQIQQPSSEHSYAITAYISSGSSCVVSLIMFCMLSRPNSSLLSRVCNSSDQSFLIVVFDFPPCLSNPAKG